MAQICGQACTMHFVNSSLKYVCTWIEVHGWKIKMTRQDLSLAHMLKNFYYSIEYCGEANASFSIFPQVTPLSYFFLIFLFTSLYLCVRIENSNFEIKKNKKPKGIYFWDTIV